MTKSTASFFDPEFLKTPDFTQWQSEFNRVLSDMSKFWTNGKASTLDANWLLTFQRKNVEALTAANQRAFEGVQALAKRQVEIARAAAEDLSKATKEFSVAGSTEDKFAKQADVAKESFKTAVARFEELAELVQKSQAETFEVIRKRVVDNFDEVRAAFEPKHVSAPSKKAA
jgi:phasin family protein